MVALGWVSLQREVWHRDAGDTWSPQGRGRKPPPSLRTSRGNMAPPTPRFHLQNCGRINFRCLQPPCLRRSVMAAPGTPGCVLPSLHVTRLLPLPCKVRRCSSWPRGRAGGSCWLLVLHQSGRAPLGSSGTPADVPEAAAGHALTQAQDPTEATVGGRAGRHGPS